MTINSIEAIIAKDMDINKNIGTFTALYRDIFVEKYLHHYLNKNWVDKKAYDSLCQYEKIIHDFISVIYKNKKTLFTSGSTESILVALYNVSKKASLKGIKHPNIILSESAHYSFYRCAKLVGLEVKKVALDSKTDKVDTKKLEQAVDSNTVLIVGIMGSTELGVIDDLEKLNDIACKHKIDLHVDAAIGGFLVPFLDKDFSLTFNHLSSLVSLNISGHKYGLSLPGCGLLLMRNHEKQDPGNDIHYLSSGNQNIEKLLVTASPLGIFSLAVNIIRLQWKGYETIAKNYISTKKKLVKDLKDLSLTCHQGHDHIPQIFVTGENIDKISGYLKEKGWIQHAYKAAGINKTGIRIVIKKEQEEILKTHFTRDLTHFFKQINIIN
jgi:glutamate/tyrosine decarboxylase-like PLP-dependent enzyme